MVAPSSFRVIPSQRPSSSSFSTSSNCNYPINHRQESLPPDTWLRNFSGLATLGFVVKTSWTSALIFNDLRVTNPLNPRRRVSTATVTVGDQQIDALLGFATEDVLVILPANANSAHIGTSEGFQAVRSGLESVTASGFNLYLEDERLAPLQTTAQLKDG